MRKKALITGITGQDGSYLAELLLGKDYEVIGLYRRSATPNLINLKNSIGNPNFSLVAGDVTDFASLVCILSKTQPDEVYNLAAQSHVGVSFHEPLHTLRVVGEGAINVFEACRLITPRARVYQAGSSEQFGSSCGLPKLIENKTINFQDENTPFLPQSPYACAKILAYNAAGMYRRAYDSHISVGILFNHESERRGENFVTRKISKYVADLRRSVQRNFGERFYKMSNIELESYIGTLPKLKLGNLESSRDWGHSLDYVRAMHLMLQQDIPDDYVIATGETHTIIEFLTQALKYVMLSHIDYNSFIQVDGTLLRPGEVPYLCGCADKAKAKLGWQPQIGFSDLVRKMVAGDYNGFE